jgi:hypothetical protein
MPKDRKGADQVCPKCMRFGAEDGLCYYCGEMTDSLAGNPSEWPVFLCHADDPGKMKPHHSGCVSKRLRDYDAKIEIKEEKVGKQAQLYF